MRTKNTFLKDKKGKILQLALQRRKKYGFREFKIVQREKNGKKVEYFMFLLGEFGYGFPKVIRYDKIRVS